MLEVDHNGTQLIILNAYAPTKDKSASQMKFFDKLTALLESHMDKQIILAGDFNTCLYPDIDKKGGILESSTEARTKIHSLLEYLDLIDIWRVRNPDKKKFSWRGKTRGGIVQSRIDYFFVSGSLADLVTSTDISHGICSDHSLS
jgi:exonuclease III